MPSFRVDRLANTSENPQRAQIVLLDVVLAQTPQETDGGRGRVELGELVLLDGFPVARGGRVDGGRLEDSRGNTESERSVDDVAGKGSESWMVKKRARRTYDR